jgi:hypothetical protein
MLADLKAYLLIPQVAYHPEALVFQGFFDSDGVFTLRIGNIHHHSLYRCEPRRERSLVMFDQNSDETLEGTEYSAVQHHRRLSAAILGDVLGVEAPRHRKIHLDRAALPHATDAIAQRELDLRAVERALARQQFPVKPLRIQRIGERLLGLVPDLVAADAILRTCRQPVDHVREAEVGVDLVQQIDELCNLGLDLRFCTENMRIILHKAAHTHNARAMQPDGSLR